MTKYQWFQKHCLNRYKVDYLLYRFARCYYRRKLRFIDTLHANKVSLNRIIYIRKYDYYLCVEYYSRRKNIYVCTILI